MSTRKIENMIRTRRKKIGGMQASTKKVSKRTKKNMDGNMEKRKNQNK